PWSAMAPRVRPPLPHAPAVPSLAPGPPPQIARPRVLHPADVLSLRRIMNKRQPIHIYDIDHDSKHHRIWEALRARDLRSALLVPLIAQDNPLGVLALGAVEPHRFGADEIALARVLASQIAAPISTFRLHETAQRHNKELSTLSEIASTITSTLDTHEVYRLVVQNLNAYFNVEAGSLLLLDEATGDLYFVMTIEGGEEKLAGVTVP